MKINLLTSLAAFGLLYCVKASNESPSNNAYKYRSQKVLELSNNLKKNEKELKNYKQLENQYEVMLKEIRSALINQTKEYNIFENITKTEIEKLKTEIKHLEEIRENEKQKFEDAKNLIETQKLATKNKYSEMLQKSEQYFLEKEMFLNEEIEKLEAEKVKNALKKKEEEDLLNNAEEDEEKKLEDEEKTIEAQESELNASLYKSLVERKDAINQKQEEINQMNNAVNKLLIEKNELYKKYSDLQKITIPKTLRDLEEMIVELQKKERNIHYGRAL